jgi:hypothetical protein
MFLHIPLKRRYIPPQQKSASKIYDQKIKEIFAIDVKFLNTFQKTPRILTHTTTLLIILGKHLQSLIIEV